jgi:pyruvate dehydrogenase E2 component (dihydrolipoamide acetyltransferase)
MQEGTVVEWHVAVGAPVTKGEVLLSIESEKAEIEIEAPATGVLRHVYVELGTTVPCGTPLAAITESAGEPFDAEAFRRTISPPQPEPPRPASVVETGTAGVASSRAAVASAAPITPAARKRAADLGIDLRSVRGSGPGGRVIKEDVEAYAAVLGARVVVAPGVALEVPSHGEGAPVLLLPGFGTDVSAFARQQPAFATRYRTRGVNPRGVGFSDAPDADCYDVRTAANDVAAVAAGARAHVIGASLGAAVAIELALEHPACVRSLTLLTPFVKADARLDVVLDAWCRLAAEASPDAFARFLLPWMFSAAFLEDATRRERSIRALVQTAARVPAASLARYATGLRRWSNSRTGDLARISVPTLVVVAAEDLLTRGGAEIAAAIPGARQAVIPGAGHAVGLEAPDQVNEAILDHLAAVGE